MLTLISEKVLKWYEAAVKMIPNIALALLTAALFYFISKMTKKLSSYFIQRVTDSTAIQNFITSTIVLIVQLIGVFISLEILNLEKTVTSILAGAGVIGLALGFAFQEIASNFVSGVFIAFKRPYRVNDIIEIEGEIGKVKEINLRTTHIMTFQGLEVLMPNKYLFTKPLTNYTTTPIRRLDISMGVAYDSDLKKVEKVTREALEKLDGRVENKEIEIFFESFEDSSIKLSSKIWVNYPDNNNYLKSRHQAIIKIKESYSKNDITIPFPIRTIITNKD